MGNHKRDTIEHALEEYGIGVVIDELKDYAKKERAFWVSPNEQQRHAKLWDSVLTKLREIENLF
jgi:hypothetical protein